MRSRDVLEHIERVLSHVRRLESSAETAVQMHFSAQSNRTNDIMRTLTVLTAIFLPLNLVTGFFGMNFEGAAADPHRGRLLVHLRRDADARRRPEHLLLAQALPRDFTLNTSRSGFVLSPRQALLLALLTLVWGLNWPVMKLGVSGFPPLSFRAVSMWLGLPVLCAVTRAMKVPLRIERRDWRELGLLTMTNMVVWYALAIVALQTLSSGRAAILGYTMPIFSAIWGALIFGQRLSPRQVAGVAAAAFGVALLLWHQLGTMAGQPWGAAGMLVSAAVWALGTQQLRRTRIQAPTLALVFWMTAADDARDDRAGARARAAAWTLPTADGLGHAALQRGADHRLSASRSGSCWRAGCRRSRRPCR